MRDRKKHARAVDPDAPEPDNTVPPSSTDAGDSRPGAGTMVEPPDQAIHRLEDEVGTLKDQHLRLAAEFDNFRKRVARERAETWEKAQADLVLRLVDVLDDLTRFAHVDPATTDATRLREGVELVERKVWKELTALGVTRIDQTGVPFDPNVHEAVTTGPAPHSGADHTVGAVLQGGYKLGKLLLRPARVQVLTWSGDGHEG